MGKGKETGTPVNALIAALKPFNPWARPERLEVNIAFVDVTKTGDILNDGREEKAPPAVADER